jgi:ribosomal protein L11 methyltransferase
VTEPRFPYIAVDVAEQDAEEAGAELMELGALGVEQRDATTLVKGAGPGKATLVASFATHDEAREAARALPESWGARVEEVVGDAWRDEWKKHFRPFEIAGGIVVRPPWEEAPAGAVGVIELEPGRAFGTGLHETTALVAEAMSDFQVKLAGCPVLDVGCGSGVLSLVALKLGAGSARAIDVDPEAVAVTRENAARNGLETRVEVDTTPVERIADRYRFVVANIEARVLVAMAPALTARVKPGGMLVLSGILAPESPARPSGARESAQERMPDQLDDVRAAYTPTMDVVGVRRKGEWVAIVLRRGR